MISEKEAEFTELRSRWDDDFDLLTLLPYVPTDNAGNARKGYETYTSSAPRNIFDKVLDGLNQAALSIQIKLQDDAAESDREAASNGELYLFGALHAIDRRLIRQTEPPLREGLGHLMCLRGWWGLKCLVYVPKGQKDLGFDVQPWDPMNMTWETGPDGLLWAALKVMRTKAQIKAEYGYDIEGKEAEVIDFWDTEGNSVIIANDTWGKKPLKHKIGHVPVMVNPVGSMPSYQGRPTSGNSANAMGTTSAGNEGGTIQYRGDSVWTASRDLYKPRNSQISTLMDIHKRASVGSLVHQTDSNDKIVGDPYRTFQIIPLKTNETLKNLELPQAPPETGAIISLMDQDIQQSTLPYPLAYGATDQTLSGRALAFLSDRTKSVFSPRTGGMSVAITWLCEELLVQFAEKGFKSTDLQGFNKNKENEFFQVTIEPKNLKPSWYIDVRVEPRLPRDRESEIQMSMMATTPRPGTEQLMSVQTAREDILLLPNPDAEANRVAVETGQNMPPIQAARIAGAMKKTGDEEGAEIMLAWMQQQGIGGPPPGPDGAPPGNIPPPSPQQQGPPGVPPAPGGAPVPGEGIPPEVVQIIQSVLMTLGQIGVPELAQNLAQILDSGQPPPPELLAQILQALTDAGQEQIAQALFDIVGPQGPPAGP